MTTSDAMELPAEGVKVLAWDEFVDSPVLATYFEGHWWYDNETRHIKYPLNGWVPLSLARKAREMEAAAKAASVLESGATLCGLCYTVNFEHMTKLRAALRDAGMGGGA